ncbi:protein SHORT-ROOT-like [Magnolia sinica]|uniref:protein SHORT-ROOT-like n=1 Tax=Magnolia sinica TaxID=86752 RepID=UPI002657CB0A|nr:protein SHORT-ROOT-like [Magnolia sinica]
MDATFDKPKVSNFFYSNQQGNALVNMHNSDQLRSSQTSTSRSSESSDLGGTGKWAAKLLRECAKAISEKDSARIHHLLWMLNELASPYGDCEQKLAAHFLQALFCKATESGNRCYKTLTSVAEKGHSFDSARKMTLKFQEVSPWTTFGHVASNGAILDALEGETKLHIIDISHTFCTQWPTLLEALATRNDETPRLRLTVVVMASMSNLVMKEVGQRMEKFARLMGVPFEFRVVAGLAQLADLTHEELGLREDEAVAVNCIGALRHVSVEERPSVVRMLRSFRPKVVTIVEEEADFTSTRGDFVECFEECLRFYSVFFEMLEESFVPTSNERLMLERESSRSIVSLLACGGDGGGECERRERGSQWCGRLREAFSPAGFSDDVVDDVKALLKRYRAGWSFVPAKGDESGLYLMWKEEAVVWVSAWKP